MSVLVFGTLAGCAKAPATELLTISTTPVDRPSLTLPSADEVRTRPVEWIVVTPENFDAKMAELANRGEPSAIFGLSGTGYENLSLNTADLRTLVEQQQRIILAYERYYQRSERALDGAVIVN
jgi:hypothetical protein